MQSVADRAAISAAVTLAIRGFRDPQKKHLLFLY
jgi:hypothetical protein